MIVELRFIYEVVPDGNFVEILKTAEPTIRNAILSQMTKSMRDNVDAPRPELNGLVISKPVVKLVQPEPDVEQHRGRAAGS